ncbi:AbrB/MazE/SpoVT family DNA-binding domain-containing protein [Acidithiobacillus acidisediminis]|uniref:AbrB/MazE/SpoVT family DNA-binding domain-containing protein n=1 Tax=Acidithiobacillus acidisediminis TaxID=2937799 RepID=UPI00200D32B7|nr:AbrB/MazE/SpoVT family DNA-binding domain-containing protein [Acidithiobacillus sp. S30A2]
MLSTLSSKGQITLPKALREQLHLRPGDKIEFLLTEGGRIEILPITLPIARLKGMAPKPQQALSLEEMDAAIRERAGKP